MTDQFKQNWQSTVQSSPKALNYRMYKDELKLENYFNVLSKKDAITLCRFRICNHHLPIENGRWVNIPRNERICNHCNKQEIGDEFHYILNCTSLQQERVKYLTLYHTKIKNVFSFKQIIANDKHFLLKILCCFIRKINKMCSPIKIPVLHICISVWIYPFSSRTPYL